jgi:hypothetical protein
VDTVLTAPSIAISAVILANFTVLSAEGSNTRKVGQDTGSPLSLRDIRSPFLPIFCFFPVFLQPFLFLGQKVNLVNANHLSSETQKRLSVDD